MQLLSLEIFQLTSIWSANWNLLECLCQNTGKLTQTNKPSLPNQKPPPAFLLTGSYLAEFGAEELNVNFHAII